MGDPAGYMFARRRAGRHRFLVLPVMPVDALSWWEGLLSDSDLILLTDICHEGAVWVAELHCPQAVRPMLREIARFPGDVYFRATVGEVARWADRFGGELCPGPAEEWPRYRLPRQNALLARLLARA